MELPLATYELLLLLLLPSSIDLLVTIYLLHMHSSSSDLVTMTGIIGLEDYLHAEHI